MEALDNYDVDKAFEDEFGGTFSGLDKQEEYKK